MTSHLVPPHGGRLVDLMASPERVAELSAHAKEMASWSLTPRQLADLELLLSGAFSPLRGFMGSAEAESVRQRPAASRTARSGRLPSRSRSRRTWRRRSGRRQPLALRDGEGVLRAVLQVEEVWRRKDPAAEAGTVCVGGTVEGVEAPHHYDFVERRGTPAQLREQFARWGWRKVLAFHTGEVMHRAEHEMTLAAARELEASLLDPARRGHRLLVGRRPLLAHPLPRGADEGLSAGHGSAQPAAARAARGGSARPPAERGRGPELRLQPLPGPGLGGRGRRRDDRPGRGQPADQARPRPGAGLQPRQGRLRGRGRGHRGDGREDAVPRRARRAAGLGARDPVVVLLPRGPAGAAAQPSPALAAGLHRLLHAACRARASPPSPTC